MAHSLSAKKRIRQNSKHRSRNRARKDQLKQSVRTFQQALAGGDQSQAAEALKAAAKKIDKLAAHRTIHKNAASRKKSRLQKKLNALAAKA